MLLSHQWRIKAGWRRGVPTPLAQLFSLPPANEVWGKVICVQACVCPQGEYLTRYTPPGEDTPQDQVHPPEQTPP